MSMDPFERQFRNLPWRKKSNDLKERIFSSTPQDEVVDSNNKIISLTTPNLAWAAIVCILGSMICYMLFRNHNSKTAPPFLVQADVLGSNGHNPKSFFDLSPKPEAPWSGTLILTIEPN